MVTLTLPYIIPLFLGMTYDARHTRPGVDIFDMKYVDDPEVTQFDKTKSVYRITSSMSEVLETLDIEGDLSLKIKTGMINIEGKGSYIKNTRDYKNRVEILTHLEYISKTKFFKDVAKPKDSWAQLFNTGVLGTHYVTSVTYGAELIASARFVVHNSSDTAQVKAEVNSAFGTGGQGMDLVAEGKLEDLEKKVSGKANLEISYYGTVPLKSIPNSIEGLRTLIENFKEQIEETDLKEGIPMSVELTSLTSIADAEDQDRFQFLKNRNLENELAEFEEKLDEMRQARLDLTAWAKALPYELDRQVEKEVGFLLRNITLTLQVFHDVVWTMDLTKGPEQLRRAFDEYDYDGEGTYLRFDKEVRKLKARLEPRIVRDIVSSDTYIHFGNKNCTAPKSITLYEGFVIASSEEGIGGMAMYDCLPRVAKKGYELVENTLVSHLDFIANFGEKEEVINSNSGIRYTKLEKTANPFKGDYAKKIEEKGVSCAKCHSPDSSAVAMFSSTDKCPLTWEVMYKGYLMSARKNEGYTTKFVCVDEEPSEPYNMDPQMSSRDTLALTVVHSAGSLPKDTFLEGALVRCVLCSMKSNQIVW